MTVHFPLLDFKNIELAKVTRYNLNCDKSFIPSLLTSLLFVGYCVGAFAGGTISGPGIKILAHKYLLRRLVGCFHPFKDRFGRKRAFTLFLLGYVVSTISLVFIDSIIAYQTMRLLQGKLISKH